MPPRDGKPKRAHRKVCSFCVEKAQYIDYKEVSRLRRFISERGKILPRRVTGTCARHQRPLTVALKRAPDRANPLHFRPPIAVTDQLRIPGPTPLPERVIRAMAHPMIDHRGTEFAAMHREVSAGVREVFGTTAADLLILSSSGTGSMESAAANLVSPGDQVVVCTCGVFG